MDVASVVRYVMLSTNLKMGEPCPASPQVSSTSSTTNSTTSSTTNSTTSSWYSHQSSYLLPCHQHCP